MKRVAYLFLFLICQLSCNMLETEIKKTETIKAAGIEIQFLNATDGYDYLMKSRFIEKMGKMDFSIRMKHQQLRLFYMSQQTKRSRAVLDMMRYDLMRITEN